MENTYTTTTDFDIILPPPSPCVSTGAQVPDKHRSEQRQPAAEARLPDRSRHILTKCDHQTIPDENTKEIDEIDNFADALGTIRASPQLDEHYDDVIEFQRWLTRVNKLSIVMRGYTHYPYSSKEDIDPFTPVEYSKQSATRWSDDYIKTVLARLYKLKDVLKDTPVLMGSFTCPHEYNKFGQLVNPGLTIPVCFSTLRHGWQLFRWRLNKHYGRTIEIVRIWEPHKMGYPHFHAILIGTFTDTDKEWMAATWADCIGYPSAKENALKWSATSSIAFPIAYLMKYMGKTLYHTYSSWNAATWVFNALAWKGKIRLFQTTRQIASLITCGNNPDPDTVYTEILSKGLPRRTIYNEDYNSDLPALITTPKKSTARYKKEAALNPAIAPFIPLSARTDLKPSKTVAERAKDFLYRQNCWRAITWLDTPYSEDKDPYYQMKNQSALWVAASLKPQRPIMTPRGSIHDFAGVTT